MAGASYTIRVEGGCVVVDDPPDYELVWSEQPAKLKAIAEACSRVGTRKVLIRGTTAQVKLTPAEIFKFGEEIARLGLRVALVTSVDASPKDQQFFTHVTRNRGSWIRPFSDEGEARAWLDGLMGGASP